MKIFLIALTLSHFDTLPPAPALHATLDRYHDQLTAATLAEFDLDHRGAWMNYIPAIGIGYIPLQNGTGQPRPTASFSLAQLFAARRQRLDRQAKRHSIEAAATLDREQAHRQLDALLQRHELLKLELETMQKVAEIDRQIFQLARMEYDEARLAPSAYLPKEKAFLEAELALLRKEMEVRSLEGEIGTFVHL